MMANRFLKSGVYSTATVVFLAAFPGGQVVGRAFFPLQKGAAYLAVLGFIMLAGLLASIAERQFLWHRVFGAQRGGLDPGPLSIALFGGLFIGLLRF